MAKEKRFDVVYHEGGGFRGPDVTVIRDTVTGVHYLFTQNGHSGGLTPLLNWDGTPVVGTTVSD